MSETYTKVSITIACNDIPSTWVVIGGDHIVPGGGNYGQNLNITYTTYAIKKSDIAAIITHHRGPYDAEKERAAMLYRGKFIFPRPTLFHELFGFRISESYNTVKDLSNSEGVEGPGGIKMYLLDSIACRAIVDNNDGGVIFCSDCKDIIVVPQSKSIFSFRPVEAYCKSCISNL